MSNRACCPEWCAVWHTVGCTRSSKDPERVASGRCTLRELSPYLVRRHKAYRVR
jgi:hypothetical protein